MVDNKDLLSTNIMLSTSDKIFNNKNNENIIKNNIINTNNDNIPFNLNNNNNKKYLKYNNKNESKINMEINDKTNDKYNLALFEELLYNKDNNKKSIANENFSESINNNVNVKSTNYNNDFKNRMDMMQAILDDELNISSDSKFLIRRRAKSRTTIKNSEIENNKIKNLKLNMFNEKSKPKEICEEKKENKNYINNIDENYNENLNKKDDNIKIERNEYFNIDHLSNDKKKENKMIQKDINKIKEYIKFKEDILEIPKKEKEKNIIAIKYNNKNQIIEEINFEIFNKKNKPRKDSYININFNDKILNKTYRRNTKTYSGKKNYKEKSKFNEIIKEKNNSKNINIKTKKFNTNYIYIKDYKNKNLNKNNGRTNSELFLAKSALYFYPTNNRNNLFKGEKLNDINNINKLYPEPLDNLMNKIKDTYENKNNNKGKNNSDANNLNSKIKDIKDSLQKINDINKDNEYNKTNFKYLKTNINKKPDSYNKEYFNILDNNYTNTKNSRNFFFLQKNESSDYIFYNNLDKRKKEINFSFPFKKLIKKTNSNSNFYTLDNSPEQNYNTKKNFLNIKNYNLNSLEYINRNRKLKNIFDNLSSNNSLKNNNFLDRENYQSIDVDDRKNKKETTMELENKSNQLYYISDKLNYKYNSNILFHKLNYSNYNERSNINCFIKDFNYNDGSKINEKIINNFINKENKYNNINNDDKTLITKRHLNNKKISYFSKNQKSKNISYKDNKNIVNMKNNIQQIHNYSKKNKQYFTNKNSNLKYLLSPFEKIKNKNIHSIFPVNPFNTIK